MLTMSLKGVLAHRFRLLTTALAIVLGVSFMAGTLVLTDTIGRTFDNLFSDVYRGTDAIVRATSTFDGPQNTGAQRGRIGGSLIDRVRTVKGIQEAQGRVYGYTRLIGKNGEALGNPAAGLPSFGMNWSDSERLNPFRIVRGRAPYRDNEIAIDAKSARD